MSVKKRDFRINYRGATKVVSLRLPVVTVDKIKLAAQKQGKNNACFMEDVLNKELEKIFIDN